MTKVDIDREINDIKLMAQNWYTGYKTWIHPDGPNDYVYEEFTEEISNVMMPYIRRLWQTEHITTEEMRELVDYIHGQVERLKEYGGRIERENKSRSLGKVVRNSRLFNWLFNAKVPK